METLLEAPFRHIVWTPPIPRPKERLEMTWKEQRKRRVRVEGRDVAVARPIWHRRGNLCRAGGRGRGLGPRITTTQQRLVVAGRFGRVPHLSALRFAGRTATIQLHDITRPPLYSMPLRQSAAELSPSVATIYCAIQANLRLMHKAIAAVAIKSSGRMEAGRERRQLYLYVFCRLAPLTRSVAVRCPPRIEKRFSLFSLPFLPLACLAPLPHLTW